MREAVCEAVWGCVAKSRYEIYADFFQTWGKLENNNQENNTIKYKFYQM